MSADPHGDQPVLATGQPIEGARAAMILVHGRGAGARDILGLTGELEGHGFAFLAPQAAGSTWYPYRFLEPIERNQPWLDSALRRLSDLCEQVRRQGVPSQRTLLLGFSQGACLTAEFLARNPRRYGGVAVLTGGLIGPPGTPRDYAGSLEGTPIVLGAGDPDPHVPWQRVEETADVFRDLGAEVTTRRHPGWPHAVHPDELAAVQAMMDGLTAELDSTGRS